MPARAGEIRFYVDASALGLGKALERARHDVVYPGHPLVAPLTQDAPDDEWMKYVAEHEWVAIGRDKHIRTRPGERELFARHGLRVFRMVGIKDMSTWDELVRLVRLWDKIEQIVDARPNGPWFMALHEGRISEQQLTSAGAAIPGIG
jgi:hypothetical protein